VIDQVDPGSPADQAGLEGGDVILALGSEPIRDAGDLRVRAATLAAGTSVPLKVLRDGQTLDLTARIAELPTLRALGVRLVEVEPDSPGEPPKLVIDQVLGGSPAARAGLREGMELVAVANRPVASRDAADEQADRLEPGQAVPLTVRQGERLREVLVGGPARRAPRR
jgi:S1-C subfamily serine protease